ncbi:hypothetical protein D3C71_1116270 [compost metagenome]
MDRTLYTVKAGTTAISIIDQKRLKVSSDCVLKKGDPLRLSDDKLWRFMYVNSGEETITVTIIT